ncbi:MAG: helix-turn-helix transcriptional regulator [Eubacteriales bacterium]|nr:helix-turn-helix transcriptional regulator [Eubacteriales bacterium]
MEKTGQPESIGLRIRQKREELHLTQETVSEILDISQTHYKNIERGRANMSLDLFLRICRELQLDPTYVLTGKQIQNNPIIDFYNSLPEDKRVSMDRAMYFLAQIYK